MSSEANLSRLRRQSATWGRLAAYLQKKGFLLYRNTQAKYFGDGKPFFDDLIEHLSKAEVYIFLEYYIPVSYTHLDVYKRQALASSMTRST